MARKFKKNTIKSFGLLAFFVVVIVVTFGVFIYKFLSYDKTKYEVTMGSVLYDDDLNFIQVAGDAYITQKMDRNYYLYEEKDGETYKYSLGKNSVVYRENDSNIYLYGKGYQVLSSGDVNVVDGETKIVKSSPTKFFKLDDRKYLIVDSSITSVDNDVVKTSGYLIIDLDKQGNPWFSNNLLSFKTVAQLVVKGSNLGFDIANEVLTYNDNKIDLKNIIGSSNEYDKNKIIALSGNTDPNLIDGSEAVDKIDGGNGGNGGGGTSVYYIGGGGGGNGQDSDVNNYYDEYLNAVIKSINNLTNSVNGVNENTNVSLSRSAAKYYDFSKWVALKSVSSDSTSVTIGYSVFDPSSEYQVVSLVVNDDIDNPYILDKNATEYTIRGLNPSTSYNIALVYQMVGSSLDVVGNTVIVRTKDVNYNVNVTKITRLSYIGEDNITYHYKYQIDYEITVDPAYKFNTAVVSLEGYDTISASEAANANGVYTWNIDSETEFKSTKNLTNAMIPTSNIYKGSFTLGEDMALKYVNILKISKMVFCSLSDSVGGCTNAPESNLVFSYKFFQE